MMNLKQGSGLIFNRNGEDKAMSSFIQTKVTGVVTDHYSIKKKYLGV